MSKETYYYDMALVDEGLKKLRTLYLARDNYIKAFCELSKTCQSVDLDEEIQLIHDVLQSALKTTDGENG